MGSISQANVSGVMCRLCCQLTNDYVYIFSEKGKSLNLVNMIAVMAVNVQATDKLPKTVCMTCIRDLTVHYKFWLKIMKNQKVIKERNERRRRLGLRRQRIVRYK